MNFAGVWKAPVVFLCQNNGYAISMPTSEQTASDGMAIKGEAYGVPGVSYAIADPLSNDTNLGCGQHGGFGNYEQKPFLFLRGGGFTAGKTVRAPSSPVDIAPTVLRHLGLACDGMDGTALATA